MVRVAVIDDGVSTDVYPFLTHLSDSIEITAAGIIKISPTNGRTHGTLCAAIIKLYAPETEIVSVKVLNSETGMGKVWKIRKALEWCLENQITVINLSAGSFSFQEKERLRKVFSKLEEKGIPLICAWPNNERFSIYTDFTWTVSVEREKTLCENQYKSRNGHFLQADFYASSIHSFPLFDESSETIVSQNSHAAPVITAMVAHNIYAEGFSSLEKIYRSLTPFQERRFHIKPVPDFINKTIVLGKIAYPEKYCTFQKNPKSLRKMLDSETPFSLSVFPPYTKSSEELAKCIYENQEHLRGVLYAGVAPEVIKQAAWNVGCLFWDESEYRSELDKVPCGSIPSSTVIVIINGERESAISLSKQLQNEFIREGYRSMIFSNWPQSYCLGMYFLPNADLIKEDIGRYINVYRPDIIWLCGDFYDIQSDMQILCCNKRFVLKYENQKDSYTLEEELVSYIKRLLFS